MIGNDTITFFIKENKRQDELWGDQSDLPDGTSGHGWGKMAVLAKEHCKKAAKIGEVTWKDILIEEVYEAFAEEDAGRLHDELIQVAVVAMQWAAAIERRLK